MAQVVKKKNNTVRKWKGQRGGGHHTTTLGAAAGRGMSGILCTCDRAREREAVKEALNILNNWADDLYPVEAKAAAPTGASTSDNTANDKLQAEIAELKQATKSGSTGRFRSLDTGVKGVLLVQIQDSKIDPIHLVQKILQHIKSEQDTISRYLARMIPLQYVCHPSVDEIRAQSKILLDRYFETVPKDKTLKFAIELKKRNCTTLKSQDIIEACAPLVDPRHKVDLKSPDVVLLIEIFRTSCGVSVVDDFHTYSKYNLRGLLESPTAAADP